LSDLLSRAALVVLLSEYEAHPVSVMEALSLRRPVLVSDTSGLRELAQKGLCRAIPLRAGPSETVIAIVEALVAGHAPPDIELPDWDDCAQRLVEVYQAVSRGGSCAPASQRSSKGTVDRRDRDVVAESV
jgi:glycosyltransferase involved in cell wall biosynthesis